MPKTKHGMHNTRLNHIWRQMKYRCTSPKAPEYKNYGGRGIKVSPRWMDSFQAFLDDMGSTYEEHLTLDRIDNNGDYGEAVNTAHSGTNRSFADFNECWKRQDAH